MYSSDGLMLTCAQLCSHFLFFSFFFFFFLGGGSGGMAGHHECDLGINMGRGVDHIALLYYSV